MISDWPINIRFDKIIIMLTNNTIIAVLILSTSDTVIVREEKFTL